MEQIEISTVNVDFLQLVKHVARDRIAVELVDGQVPLARLIPVERTHSMAELQRAMSEAARLCDDADTFSHDVLSVRESLGTLADPWDS